MALTTLRCKRLKRILNTVLTVNGISINTYYQDKVLLFIKALVTPSVACKMRKINKNLVEFQDFVNFEASG